MYLNVKTLRGRLKEPIYQPFTLRRLAVGATALIHQHLQHVFGRGIHVRVHGRRLRRQRKNEKQ